MKEMRWSNPLARALLRAALALGAPLGLWEPKARKRGLPALWPWIKEWVLAGRISGNTTLPEHSGLLLIGWLLVYGGYTALCYWLDSLGPEAWLSWVQLSVNMLVLLGLPIFWTNRWWRHAWSNRVVLREGARAKNIRDGGWGSPERDPVALARLERLHLQAAARGGRGGEKAARKKARARAL